MRTDINIPVCSPADEVPNAQDHRGDAAKDIK